MRADEQANDLIGNYVTVVHDCRYLTNAIDCHTKIYPSLQSYGLTTTCSERRLLLVLSPVCQLSLSFNYFNYVKYIIQSVVVYLVIVVLNNRDVMQ
jgi:hypothetical protein